MKDSTRVNNILNIVATVFRRSFWTIIGFTAVMTVAMSIVSYIINLIFMTIFMPSTVSLLNGSQSYSGVIGFGIMYAIMIMISIILQQFIKVGHIQGVMEAKNGIKIDFGGMFSYAVKNTHYILSSTLIYAVILIVAYGIFFGITGFLNYYLFKISEVTRIWPYIILNSILVIIGIVMTLWIAIKTYFYLPIAVTRKMHFVSPMIESFSMAKNCTKRLLVYVLTIIIATSVIYFGLMGGIGLVSAIGPIIAAISNPGVAVVLGIIMYLFYILVVLFVSAVIAPVGNIFMAVAYFDERDRKYGDDLFEALNYLKTKHRELLKMEMSNDVKVSDI